MEQLTVTSQEDLDWDSLTFVEKSVHILRALEDPTYFLTSPWFLGEEPRLLQAQIVKDFYKSGKRELVCSTGMRAGKTFILSCFLLFETFVLLIKDDPAKHYGLSAGSRIFVTGVSYSADQAIDTLFNECRTKVERSPFFKSYKMRISEDGQIRFLDKNVVLRVFGSNSPGVSGKSNKAVGFDEVDKFVDIGKRAGRMTYRMLSRSVRTFPDGHKFTFSSPLLDDGMIISLLARAEKKPEHLGELAKEYWHDKSVPEDPVRMGVHFATWEFNPLITRESLDDEFNDDYVDALRDYGAIPPSGVDSFFGDPSILKVTERPNLLELLKQKEEVTVEPGWYVLAGDPALKLDSFGVALGRKVGDTIYIEGSERWSPSGSYKEVDAIALSQHLLDVVTKVPVSIFVSDTWNFPETLQRIRLRGVFVVNHIVRKPEYDRAKELFHADQLKICDFPYVLKEFKSLGVLQSLKIVHPRHTGKDCADAIVNCIWALENVERKPFAFNIVKGIGGRNAI